VVSIATCHCRCNLQSVAASSVSFGLRCPLPSASKSSVECRLFQASAVLCQRLVGVRYDRSIVLLCRTADGTNETADETGALISTNPWHHDFSRCKSYACLPFLSGVRPSKYVQHSSQLLEVHIGVPVNCISLSE
jgi:hypothetical protein